jgi:hypothetical protein
VENVSDNVLERETTDKRSMQVMSVVF